ncbi:photosynthetic complex putative assembly protein PuhB [uncultured Rhodoblastus sp.]|uniref:photosynthetic complex putative assembly protein PuhB n=1 Tax=uncultured Rhodoblastus sp. TaxID=543037 RepID=UPI0025F29A64|nr:photosynthetic complex putative assembly protein PuhB [uncultured Rhodoblastus sp.]
MKTVNLAKLLPTDIPPGERVLWFGRPDPTSLWRKAYRADWVMIWFAALTAWSFLSALADEGAASAALAALRSLAFGGTSLALLGFLAWLGARNSLYVVTERRLVIKSGVALPIFINLPFQHIVAADVRLNADGTGDVSARLAKDQHVPYIALWPSARPFRFADPEPTLRCVPQAKAVAETLGRALSAAAGQEPTPAKRPAAGVGTGEINLPALA